MKPVPGLHLKSVPKTILPSPPLQLLATQIPLSRLKKFFFSSLKFAVTPPHPRLSKSRPSLFTSAPPLVYDSPEAPPFFD